MISQDYKILFQTLITLDESEIQCYKNWMMNKFDTWLGVGFVPDKKLLKKVSYILHGDDIHIIWNGKCTYVIGKERYRFYCNAAWSRYDENNYRK